MIRSAIRPIIRNAIRPAINSGVGGLTLPKTGLLLHAKQYDADAALILDKIGMVPDSYTAPSSSVSLGDGDTYYVDATDGSDAAAGTSEATAWQTIAKVNASTFSAGDNILFKRGEVWREQLTVPSSGTSGSPILFGAYGAGDLPVINGADLVTEWEAVVSTLLFAPSDGADDGHINFTISASVFTGTTFIIGVTNTTHIMKAGIRFRDVSLSQGDSFQSAKITLVGNQVNSANDCNVRIYGELSLSPEPLSTLADFNARSFTESYVDWNKVPTFSAGSTQESPDVTPIIEEIIAQEGWESGGNIMLFVVDNGSTNNAGRAARAVEGGVSTATLSIVTATGIYRIDYDSGGAAVTVGGIEFEKNSDLETLTTGKYFNDTTNNKLYIKTAEDPDSVEIEVSARDYGVWGGLRQYVTISDICTPNSRYAGIRFYGNQPNGYNLIHGCIAKNNHTVGIVCDGGSNRNTIHGCVATKNGNGILLNGASDYSTIENCLCYENKTSASLDGDGLGAFNSINATIKNNTCHSNDGDGIDIDSNNRGTKIIVSGNLSYNNGLGGEGYGINIANCVGDTNDNIVTNNILANNNIPNGFPTNIVAYENVLIANNVFIHASSLYNTSVFVVGDGVSVVNNISFIPDGLWQRAIRLPSAEYAGEINNNCWFNSSGAIAAEVGVAKEWEEWQALGYDANSISSDPLLNADYTLQSTSPCIGAGTDPFVNGDGDQYDAAGYKVWDDTTDLPDGHWVDGVDIGAYAYGGGDRYYNHLTVESGTSWTDFVVKVPADPALVAADDGTLYTAGVPNELDATARASMTGDQFYFHADRGLAVYDAALTGTDLAKADKFFKLPIICTDAAGNILVDDDGNILTR